MASASSNHQPVQCTQDSLLNNKNTRCIPPRTMETLPNNTSSARQGRVGGDQCDCLCWQGTNTDDPGRARQHRGEQHPVQCSQENALDANSRRFLEPPAGDVGVNDSL